MGDVVDIFTKRLVVGDPDTSVKMSIRSLLKESDVLMASVRKLDGMLAKEKAAIGSFNLIEEAVKLADNNNLKIMFDKGKIVITKIN